MCSICLPLGFPFRKQHNAAACPYVRACYCSYCGTNGHTTGQCPERFCDDEECPAPSPAPINEYSCYEHAACLEVIDHESNIRAFLISFGIALSGKPETNRDNLIQACRYHNPPLRLYWIDPATGESHLHIDEPPAPKKRNSRKAQAAKGH